MHLNDEAKTKGLPDQIDYLRKKPYVENDRKIYFSIFAYFMAIVMTVILEVLVENSSL